MSARVRTVAAAIRDWIVSPVTMTAAMLVAVIMGVSCSIRRTARRRGRRPP